MKCHQKNLSPNCREKVGEIRPRIAHSYLDANNLYGHAISQYLPTGGFRILSDEEVEVLELDNI